MGVVVKLGKSFKKDPNYAYEFTSDKSVIASFGRTTVCAELMEVLDDWVEGLGNDYDLYDVATQGHEIAKIQGRREALLYFKEFLNGLRDLDRVKEKEDDT